MTLTERCRHDAEQLASQFDLEKVLAERRRQEEAEKAKAAEAEARTAGLLAPEWVH